MAVCATLGLGAPPEMQRPCSALSIACGEGNYLRDSRGSFVVFVHTFPDFWVSKNVDVKMSNQILRYRSGCTVSETLVLPAECNARKYCPNQDARGFRYNADIRNGHIVKQNVSIEAIAVPIQQEVQNERLWT